MTIKKSTLATLVGAAALATAGAANATIVVGGDNGYEFSVDGNINQFYIYSDQNSAAGKQDNSQVANGLLPTFFGFNVKSPEINGLTMGARVSISPSTNNGSYDGSMEQREAFATIDGSFGQILAGKALGLYSANNILLDQTLFGVGATAPTAAGDQNSGTTTLGRIGWGYDYAYWRSQIRYTTPDMNGFQAAIAVLDADDSASDGYYNVAVPYTNIVYSFGGNATVEKDPRFEASLSYATAFDGGSMKLWLDGMTQRVKVAGPLVNGGSTRERSNAWTLGGQLVFSGFEAVAAYYDNKGVGMVGGLATGTALDNTGKARDGEGYYVQAGYRFAGQTFVAASYGESELDRTSWEKANDVYSVIDKNDMWTVGVYHDVNANLKLVAEYSKMETEFHTPGAKDAKTDVFAIGGFVTW